jgi:hypothetical protein
MMTAWRSGVFKRAMIVALLVGTALNLINQGDAVARGASVNWIKLILTYVVPFAVSSHGAITAGRRRMS